MSEKVQAVLNLDPCALHYRVRLEPDEMRELAGQFADYNQATSEALVALVGKVDKLIPPMNFGGNNPNNGHTHHHYFVGREYSRVVYLEVIKAYLPDSFDYVALGKGLARIGREAGADETDITANDFGEFVYRFWWD